MNSEDYSYGDYCHNLNICKVIRFPVSISSLGPTFQILLKLSIQPGPSAKPKESNKCSSFFLAVLLLPLFLSVMPGWFLKKMRMALKRQNEFT